MALFGTGNLARFWQSPAFALPDGGGKPVWVALWNRGGTIAANGGLATFAKLPIATGASIMGLYATTTPTFVCIDSNDAGSPGVAQGGVPSLTNVWQHVIGLSSSYTGTTARTLYVNGAATNNNTGIVAPQTFTGLVVGRGGAGASNANRSVAEVVFGRGAISPGLIQALVGGANPLAVVPPAQLLAYYPLRGDLRDYGPFGLHLAPIGGALTVWDEHPPVAPARPRRLPVRRGVVAAPRRRPSVSVTT